MDTLTQGGIQKMNFISEPNLYKLIFQSRKPEAEKFADWVTSEVLPAIVHKGVYMTDKKAYDITHDRSGATLADLLQQAADQLKQKDIQIAEMKPKALFADAVATSNRSILVGELAKLIRQIWMKSRLKILLKLLVTLNDIQMLPQKLNKR